MKKFLSIIMALMCVCMMASCRTNQNNNDGNGDDTIIELDETNFDAKLNIWWAPGDKYVTPLEDGLEKVKSRHPEFDYEIKQQASTDYYDRLSTILMTPNPRNAPDIVRISNTGIQSLAAYNKFVNFSRFEGNDEFGNNFFPNLWNANKLNDDVYGLPLDANTMTLMYNTEIFEKCGIEAPPTNRAEFEAACDKVLKYNKENNASYLPYDLALMKKEGSADLPVFCLNSVLSKLGGTMLSKDNKTSNITSPEMIDALELLAEWKEKGYIDGSWREGEFYTGDIAMFEMGSWNKNIISGGSSLVDGKIKVAPTFSLKEGIPGKSTLGLYSLAVYNGKDKNKIEVAYNVIKELLLDDEFMLNFCKSADLLPTRKVVYDNEYFNTDFYKTFKIQLDNSVARPGSPAWKAIEDLTGNMMEDIYINGKSIIKATTEAKDKIQKKIADYDKILNK